MCTASWRSPAPSNAERAWHRYVHVQTWPEWAPFIVRVFASGEILEPGLSGVVHGPVGSRVAFVVDAVDHAARSWRWSARFGPVGLQLGHEVLARPAGGTVATLTLTGPASVVLGYRPAAALALRRLIAEP